VGNAASSHGLAAKRRRLNLEIKPEFPPPSKNLAIKVLNFQKSMVALVEAEEFPVGDVWTVSRGNKKGLQTAGPAGSSGTFFQKVKKS